MNLTRKHEISKGPCCNGRSKHNSAALIPAAQDPLPVSESNPALGTDIVINQPPSKGIYVIADNLSAHKSAPVKEFPTSFAAVEYLA